MERSKVPVNIVEKTDIAACLRGRILARVVMGLLEDLECLNVLKFQSMV